MTNFSFENFPVDGVEGVLRQVGFGLGSKSVILVEFSVDEDTGDMEEISVTVGNGPDHESALEDTAELLDYVSEILRSDSVKTNYEQVWRTDD
jgi:hypothetical protein